MTIILMMMMMMKTKNWKYFHTQSETDISKQANRQANRMKFFFYSITHIELYSFFYTLCVVNVVFVILFYFFSFCWFEKITNRTVYVCECVVRPAVMCWKRRLRRRTTFYFSTTRKKRHLNSRFFSWLWKNTKFYPLHTTTMMDQKRGRKFFFFIFSFAPLNSCIHIR